MNANRKRKNKYSTPLAPLNAPALLKGKTSKGTDRRLLRWLYKWLSTSVPDADADLITKAIADVFLKYRRKPEAFDSHCGVPLEFYLLYAAARRVSKLLEGEEAQIGREYPLAKCA